MGEQWLKWHLSYRHTNRMARTVKGWCADVLGVLDCEYTSTQWQTIACIARNLDDSMGDRIIIPRDKNYYQQGISAFPAPDYRTALLFLDYLKDKGIIDEKMGYKGISTTYAIINRGLWDLEKDKVLINKLTKVNLKVGKCFIIKKTKDKVIGWKLDKAQTKTISEVNRQISELIKSLGFSFSLVDYNKLPFEAKKQTKKFLHTYTSISTISPSQWYPFPHRYTDLTRPQLSTYEANQAKNDVSNPPPKIDGIDVMPLKIEALLLHKSDVSRRIGDENKNKRWVNFGGRVYHGALSLPREMRAGLVANGLPLCEIDLKSSHPYQAYCEVGQAPPIDCYFLSTLTQWQNTTLRKHIKILMLCALNADSRKSAILGATEKMSDLGLLPLSVYNIDAGTILDAIEVTHPAIAGLLYSDRGVRYMGAEGEMCLAALGYALASGAVLVPIHDGFLCHEAFRADLEAFLGQWCLARFGFEPTIETK